MKEVQLKNKVNAKVQKSAKHPMATGGWLQGNLAPIDFNCKMVIFNNEILSQYVFITSHSDVISVW